MEGIENYTLRQLNLFIKSIDDIEKDKARMDLILMRVASQATGESYEKFSSKHFDD